MRDKITQAALAALFPMNLRYWASWRFHVKLVLRLATLTLLIDFLPYLLKSVIGVDVASTSSGPVLHGAALLTTTAAVVVVSMLYLGVMHPPEY